MKNTLLGLSVKVHLEITGMLVGKLSKEEYPKCGTVQPTVLEAGRQHGANTKRHPCTIRVQLFLSGYIAFFALSRPWRSHSNFFSVCR